MENKAHYTLIGAFIIFLLVSLFVFLIWLAKYDIDENKAEYDIYFSESVFGLNVGSPVTYNGIPVGQVLSLVISPKDPSKVLVTIQIEDTTPILVDSLATLGMQGITGVLFVQIMGGAPGSPVLEAKEGEPRPVIPSKPSALGELLGGGGDLIQNALETLDRVNRIMSDDNINHISESLGNFEQLTNDLAAEGETIRATLQALEDTVSGANTFLNEDLKPITEGLTEFTENANSLMARLDKLVADSEGGFSEFSNQGLPELRLLISDLRALTQSLTNLSRELEERPSAIIFKTQEPEYEVDK